MTKSLREAIVTRSWHKNRFNETRSKTNLKSRENKNKKRVLQQLES